MRRRRGLALLLFAALLLALFAPSALAHEHDPLHCAREDCSVCHVICAGSALLRMLSLSLAAIALTRAPALCATAWPGRAARADRPVTLISLKVKMTN